MGGGGGNVGIVFSEDFSCLAFTEEKDPVAYFQALYAPYFIPLFNSK